MLMEHSREADLPPSFQSEDGMSSGIDFEIQQLAAMEKSSRRFPSATFALMFIVVASVAFVTYFDEKSTIPTAAINGIKGIANLAQSTASSSLPEASLVFGSVDASIVVSSPDYGEHKGLQYLPWDTVAEVYREQEIKIDLSYTDSSSKKLSPSEDDISVKWKILGQTYNGISATFVADAIPGVYECTVTVTSKGDGSELYSKEFTMAVKYIRREIRSLTDDDRQRYFSALMTMYTTSAESGKKKYGDKFNNAEYFLAKHLNGAGRSDCDHWHDGAGAVVKHLAFTLEAEQSLQAIDRTISMPYWEYFSDSYLTDWTKSDVFNSDWYGEANPLNSEHKPSGTWGELEFPDGSSYQDSWSIKAEGSLNPFANAYGQMRSPWNNNPSAFIGRRNTTYGRSIDHMPNCKVMSECYASNDLAAMTNCLNGVTHGPVHVLIGGSWGDEEMYADGDINFMRNINRILYFKNLWRTGYTRCPEKCGKNDECRCAVPQTYLDTYSVDEIFQNAGVYDLISRFLRGKNDEYKLKVLRAMEDPGIVGDMLTSAAPYDPSFWPIHGQLERIMGLKRSKVSQGDIKFDETWGFGGANSKYLEGVCDWSRVESVDDLTLPACDFTGETLCFGHGEDDELEFSDFLGLKESYTNKKFYDFVHPWSDSLPYTYDTFDFDYCNEYGTYV